MGRWFAHFLLKEGNEVIITGQNQSKLLAAGEQLGVETATNTEAARNADVVVLSVPIDSFETIVEQIAPYIRPKQIVIDVTSIKELPVQIMHQHITTGLVLGIHPMFGPGASSIANHNFVLTPTNDAETALAQKVKEYLEARGARVMLMTPGEHDELMSIILGLCHFIALVSADTLLSLNRLKQMETIGGTTYKVLLTLVGGVVSEDPELYASLHMRLPNMVAIEALFRERATTWADLVKRGDKQQFIQKMSHLKHRLKEANPDFEKAYQNMYRLIEGL